MIDIRSQSIGDFLDSLASGNATPGGGAATALSGAMSAALLSMVMNLTLGRKRYAAAEGEMLALRKRVEAIRVEMTRLAQEDANVFERVMAAYRLPKRSEVQQSVRKAAIQNTLMDATQIPLKVASQAGELLDCLPVIIEKGNPNAVGDAAAGLWLADAIMQGALMNVQINLGLIHDEAFKAGIQAEVAKIQAGREAQKSEMLVAVQKKLSL